MGFPYNMNYIEFSDVPVGSCGDDSYFGLGIMDGNLEKCSEWKETDEVKQAEYEKYKCTHLRGTAAHSLLMALEKRLLFGQDVSLSTLI